MTTPAEKTLRELKNFGIDNVSDYLRVFGDILGSISASPFAFTKNTLEIDRAISLVVLRLHHVFWHKKRLIAIGNGGSAAIAIHVLADYAHAGGLQTIDLINPALITCMANDYGYENVFAKSIEASAEKGNILFAISSSGQSPNILLACEAAIKAKCEIITFSGFDPMNPLRKLGDVNFYVPSNHFGFVELAHQILVHCILDFYLKRRIEHNW